MVVGPVALVLGRYSGRNLRLRGQEVMAEEAFYQRSDPKKGDIFHQDLKAIGMTEAVDFWTEGERGYVPKEGEHI